MLADGDLQMRTLLDGRDRVMTTGFVNPHGGSNVNVVEPTSDIYPGSFGFQGGMNAVMAAMEAALAYEEELQPVAQASPNAGPDGS